MKPQHNMHTGLYNAIFQEEDVKWQSMIYEMIRTGKVDPWDVDLSVFANEYMKMLKNMKDHNFRISGKVVLAAAILLKIKTNRLGLTDFLGMIEEPTDEDLGIELEEIGENEVFVDEEEAKLARLAKHIKHNTPQRFGLEPRIPTVRERKVSVLELVKALKKAMKVEARRERRQAKIERIEHKEYKIKKVNIYGKIQTVVKRLRQYLLKSKKNTVDFRQLIPSTNKKDIVWTFIPILHLAQHGKVELHQEKPFSPILIEVIDKDMEIRRTKVDKA